MSDGKGLPQRTPGPTGHNDANDPSANPKPVFGSPLEGQLLAKPPARGARQKAKRRKDHPTMGLTYLAMPNDMLGYTNKAAIPIGSSSIIARDGTSYLLHGNNRIGVWRDSEDLTSKKGTGPEPIYRVWRVWSAPLEPHSRSRAASYTTGTNGNFTNDGTGGHLWVDVPGVTVSPKRSERVYRRHLIEFLVGVEGRPDAGGLYFIVVIDETPDEYRVQMHRPIYYDAEDWEQFFPLGFGLNDVDTDTGPETRATVAAHSWKPVAQEDDLPVMLDYGGWKPFPKE